MKSPIRFEIFFLGACNVKQTITCSHFHNIGYCVAFNEWVWKNGYSTVNPLKRSVFCLLFPHWQCDSDRLTVRMRSHKDQIWETNGIVYSVNEAFLRLNILTKETSEGDGWRESSKVDKDDSSKNLNVQSISDVTDIVLIPSLHVSNHATEWNTSTC